MLRPDLARREVDLVEAEGRPSELVPHHSERSPGQLDVVRVERLEIHVYFVLRVIEIVLGLRINVVTLPGDTHAAAAGNPDSRRRRACRATGGHSGLSGHVPVGGELDYLDEGTLSAAMRQRTLF